MLITRLFMKK